MNGAGWAGGPGGCRDTLGGLMACVQGAAPLRPSQPQLLVTKGAQPPELLCEIFLI